MVTLFKISTRIKSSRAYCINKSSFVGQFTNSQNVHKIFAQRETFACTRTLERRTRRNNINNNEMRTFSLYIPNRICSLRARRTRLRYSHVVIYSTIPWHTYYIRISAPFDLKYILCATQSESNCRHVVVRWKLFYFLLIVVFVVAVVVVFGFHCGNIFGVTVVCGR